MNPRIAEAKQFLADQIADPVTNRDGNYTPIIVEGFPLKTLARGMWNLINCAVDFGNADELEGEAFQIEWGLFCGSVARIILQLNASGCLSEKNYNQQAHQLICYCKSFIDAIKEMTQGSEDEIRFEPLDDFVAHILGVESNSFVEHSGVTNSEDILHSEDSFIEAPLSLGGVQMIENAPLDIREIINQQYGIENSVKYLFDNFDQGEFACLSIQNESLKTEIANLINHYNDKHVNEGNELAKELYEISNTIERVDKKKLSLEMKSDQLEGERIKLQEKIENTKMISKTYNTIVNSKDYSKSILIVESNLNKNLPVSKVYEVIGTRLPYQLWEDKSRTALFDMLNNAPKIFRKNIMEISQKKELTHENLKGCHQQLIEAREKLRSVNARIEKLHADFKFHDVLLGKCNQCYDYLKENLLNLQTIHVFPRQVENWEASIESYFDRRNETYRVRDGFERVATGFLGFFGSSKKPQKVLREEFSENTLKPAFQQYKADGNRKALLEVLAKGETFPSRASEDSDVFKQDTFKGKLRAIADEVKQADSPKLNQM